jgi:hypothetical protein
VLVVLGVGFEIPLYLGLSVTHLLSQERLKGDQLEGRYSWGSK